MQEKILPDLIRDCPDGSDTKNLKILQENKDNDKVDKVIEEIRLSERRFGDILQQIIKVRTSKCAMKFIVKNSKYQIQINRKCCANILYCYPIFIPYFKTRFARNACVIGQNEFLTVLFIFFLYKDFCVDTKLHLH